MDQGGYSYEVLRAYLDSLGFIKDEDCSIGNIELWDDGGFNPVTFSVVEPVILPNRMPDIITAIGKTMPEFLAFYTLYNAQQV